MYDLIEQLSTPWAIRAILTSSMVGITCGLLGAFIVLRNMSLIGDALAHAILPGIFIAFLIFGYNVLGFFTGSVLAGLFTAFGITWIQQKVSTKNDAAIGIVFSCMFAIGVMGISKVSKKGVHLDLTDFLFGEVLGISNADIYMTFAVMIFVVLSVILFYRYLFITTFQATIAKTMGINVNLVHYFLMFLLSFAVVSALSSVGVILVVAMLITPAATALLIAVRLKNVIIISSIIGLVSANLGLIIAIIFDTNPGPAMTVTVTAFYLLVVFLAPQKGLVFKYFRKRKEANNIEQEDVLKAAIKGGLENALDLNKIGTKLGFSSTKLKSRLQSMKKSELVNFKNGAYFLSKAGVLKANQLVRAHRLWESYLVNQAGMKEYEIHDEAEILEHVLSNATLDEVDEKLGFPEMDPHGSPIPKKATILLHQAAINKPYIIITDQASDDIDAQLWELGILPNRSFKVSRKSDQFIDLNYENKRVRLPSRLADKIRIR